VTRTCYDTRIGWRSLALHKARREREGERGRERKYAQYIVINMSIVQYPNNSSKLAPRRRRDD